MKKDVLLKISGFSGLILPIVTIASFFISLQGVPNFSWTENAISDLGRPGEAIYFFNVSMMFIGLLLMIFSLSLFKIFQENKLTNTIIFFSSLFLIGIGVFPLPNPNHIFISGLFFIAFPIGFLLLGMMLINKKNSFLRKMGFYALFNSILAVFSAFLLLFLKGVAISEALIVIPGFIWCMLFGFKILVGSDSF